MTDITSIAQRMREAAEEEIMCREASDTSDRWQDEASPENVRALCDALAQRDAQIAALLPPARNLLMPALDSLDADDLRHVIQTCVDNYAALHAEMLRRIEERDKC